MIRAALLAAARSDRLRSATGATPITRAVVTRYVPGEAAGEVVAAAEVLAGQGLNSTIDHLGEDTLSLEVAIANRDAYLDLLGRLAERGLTDRVEVSVKLSALGQALGADGPALATEHAQSICAAASAVGTTVTLDMEDHTTTDLTLATLAELRQDFPETGAVLQSYLHRTEGDCRDLAAAGSRVRLCKGAYREPSSVAFESRREIDRNYVRCLRVLMDGPGYPMVATHDPRLVDIAEALAVRSRRAPGEYEYQMLYGVRADEQRRLAGAGETVRVYLPYGAEWYGYLVRRMAEKPANLGLFLRSLVGGH